MSLSANQLTGATAGRDFSPRTLLLGLLLVVCCYYGNLAKDSYMDDFRAFYVASSAIHHGLDPYTNHVDLDERYADGLWNRSDSRFLYPPSALFFLSPLDRLPYKWSKTAFGLLMALAMVSILWQLQRKFPGRELILLTLFLTLPMFMNIDNGQIDSLMLAMALAAFYLGDTWLGGVLLGIAIALKLEPALALLWFLGARRWRTAAGSVLVSAALLAAGWMRFGSGYFREFFTHLTKHLNIDSLPTIQHVFVSVKKIGNTVMVSNEGIFSYQHDIGGYLQNPLRLLGPAGILIGWLLVFGCLLWLFGTARGRALSAQQSFFVFLVVALLANPLLWTMGLVACFPLTVLLIDESATPNKAALLLLVPLLLTKQLIGNFNFTLWIAVAVYCMVRSGWFWASPANRNNAPVAAI